MSDRRSYNYPSDVVPGRPEWNAVNSQQPSPYSSGHYSTMDQTYSMAAPPHPSAPQATHPYGLASVPRAAAPYPGGYVPASPPYNMAVPPSGYGQGPAYPASQQQSSRYPTGESPPDSHMYSGQQRNPVMGSPPHTHSPYARPNPIPAPVQYPASPSRPYSCDMCALSFNRQHDLKRHRETHSGEKPFLCNGGCGKTFTRKDALKRHQLVKHCGYEETS